jgi:putative membrane protein
MYPYILSIHIIFVVCWFAGLFYMVRLFIYHTEAQEKPEPDRSILSTQFEIMERKLWYIITVPSMFLVLAAGITLLVLVPGWLQQPWMHLKLCFVVALIIFKWKSTLLRLWNEVATIFLFAIVFIAVLKSALSWIYGTFGLIALAIVLMIAVKIYKRARGKK